MTLLTPLEILVPKSTVVVTSQAELEAAVKDGAEDIVIPTSDGVWLYLSGSSKVRAYGSAKVRASRARVERSRWNPSKR